MARDRTTRAALIAIAAGLVLLLTAQGLAPVVMPQRGVGARTEATLGSAGFAYLTGFRVFAAALLWNRLEPTMHEYYGGRTLAAQTFMVPAIRMVTWLNPQYPQAYYVGQWIVAKNGHVDEALALTADGVRDNPRSGLLLASQAQMLYLYGHLAGAERAATAAVAPGVKWSDALEEWEQLGELLPIFRKSGDTAASAYVEARRKALDAEATRLAREQSAQEAQEGSGK